MINMPENVAEKKGRTDMKIAVKEVGRKLQIIECNEKYRINGVRQFTGKENNVDIVRLSNDGCLTLGVNGEGLWNKLPTNFLLEMMNPIYPIQKIVGTVVFTRVKHVNPYAEDVGDFELVDLTDCDIQLIQHILDEDKQKELQQHFDDYGKSGIVFTIS